MTQPTQTKASKKAQHIHLTPEQEEMLLDLQLMERFSVRDFLDSERPLLESLRKAKLITRFNGTHLLHVSNLGELWCSHKEQSKRKLVQQRIDLIEKIVVVLERVVTPWVASDEFMAICQPKYSRDRRLKNKTLNRILALFARVQKAATLPDLQLICHEALRCAIAAQSWTTTVASCLKISRASYSEYLLFIVKSLQECVAIYRADPQTAEKDAQASTDKLLYVYRQELRRKGKSHNRQEQE